MYFSGQLHWLEEWKQSSSTCKLIRVVWESCCCCRFIEIRLAQLPPCRDLSHLDQQTNRFPLQRKDYTAKPFSGTEPCRWVSLEKTQYHPLPLAVVRRGFGSPLNHHRDFSTGASVPSEGCGPAGELCQVTSCLLASGSLAAVSDVGCPSGLAAEMAQPLHHAVCLNRRCLSPRSLSSPPNSDIC